MPTDPNELGALWSKTGRNGEYMTGTISGVKVVLFKNTKKTSEKHPDWRVLKSVPKGDTDSHKAQAQAGDNDF
jgi:uncharacterized protein (DUF736 family)